MNKLDFSNRELLDKYYKEMFTFDLSNYFVVNGWKELDYSRKYKVSEDTFVLNLHTRGRYTFDGDPAIYLGCCPSVPISRTYFFEADHFKSECIK